MIKAIIVDDELNAIRSLKWEVDKFCQDIEIIDSFTNPIEAISAINYLKPDCGKTVFVNSDEIMYCKSDGNYTEIFFKEQKKEVLSKKLKDVELLLQSENFFRVHKSYLVNVKYIKEFVKSDGHYLVLENDVTIPVARLKKNELLDFLCN